MKALLKPSLNWLLVFVPAAVALEYLAPTRHTWIFLCACLSIIPLAGWMGTATEHLAEHTGDGIGGLLNATFGNAAELIIALMALHHGLYDVVKASLTGSIIGNILLVLGAAFLAGGARHKVQKFSASAARTYTSMLSLAAIALVVPAAFHFLSSGDHVAIKAERDLSLEIALVLIVTYGLSLWFSLKTHKHLFTGPAAGSAKVDDADEPGGHGDGWSVRKSVLVLLGVTAVVAWMSEILVGSVEHTAHDLGWSNVFIGIIVLAIIGNAAEHSTAILVAMKNRMDLAIGVAVGSSIQIALFVAPVLVFASYFIAPQPLDLVFTPAEVLAVVVAVMVAGQVTSDGESNWLEGVQLLSVYAILALVFFLLPDHTAAPATPNPH
jgi:Ca2+:H+ antiporter